MGFVDSNSTIYPDCENEKEIKNKIKLEKKNLIRVEWRVNYDKNHINL